MPTAHGKEASYAVVWQEPDEILATGKLLLEPDSLLLEGTRRDHRLAAHRLAYAEIMGVRIGRRPEECLNCRPTLILERRTRPPLRIEAIGPGLLGELADLLARLSTAQVEGLDRLVVIAPLRQGGLERARSLLAEGPPFDPEEAGLERHEVFLTETEVIFLFEGQQVSESVRRLARDPGLWRAALGWSACLAGRPRLAEAHYSWTKASV
jgi:hypothetical protein